MSANNHFFNVCYDISVLGLALKDNKSRTGIFRVVQNVLSEMTQMEHLRIFLDCKKNLEIISWCLENVNANQYSDKTSFIHSSSINLKLIDIGYLCKKIEKKIKKRIAETNREENYIIFSYYLILTGLKKIMKTTRLVNNASIDYFLTIEKNKIFLKSDIYHSPFFSIPEEIRQNEKMKKFLTVYDLIPLIYPHYFNSDMDDFFKPLVSNICKNDWIISISESTKNDLCEFRNDIDPARVIVVPLAADKNIFYPCKESKILDDVRKRYKIPEGPYVLSVNTMEPRKNMEQVINSFFKLCQEERIDDLSLVLVGVKGWKYEGIFNLLLKHETLQRRIVITGYVPDEDMAALYSGAMVFVYPSFYEGFGLPPLEAMQCGVPVIVSNTSSLPEVVGDAGILVDPKDGDAVCQGILDIYHDNDLRMQMAAKSLKNAERFSWKRCAEETVAAYRTSLSE